MTKEIVLHPTSLYFLSVKTPDERRQEEDYYKAHPLASGLPTMRVGSFPWTPKQTPQQQQQPQPVGDASICCIS